MLLERPTLNDSISADVVIIKGSFTGVSVALRLARDGVDVVLLDLG